jgi:hypothetical protein
MESQDTGKLMEQKMKALLAEKQARNPFIPTRRMRKSSSASAPVAATPAPASATASGSNAITPCGRPSQTDGPPASAQADRASSPLPRTDNLKEIVKCQTQGSPLAAVSNSTERAKRSHDNDALDTAKRLRFTPQLQAASDSITSEKKIARVGSPMPYTVTKYATTFRAHVAQVEEQLQKQCNVPKAKEEVRF